MTITVSDWLFCRGNLILHQKRNENYKKNFLMKNNKKDAKKKVNDVNIKQHSLLRTRPTDP